MPFLHLKHTAKIYILAISTCYQVLYQCLAEFVPISSKQIIGSPLANGLTQQLLNGAGILVLAGGQVATCHWQSLQSGSAPFQHPDRAGRLVPLVFHGGPRDSVRSRTREIAVEFVLLSNPHIQRLAHPTTA